MQLFSRYSITTQWVFLAVTGLATQLFHPTVHSEPSLNQDLQTDTPSRELLEFLVSYGDIDEESFELIVFHGKRDIETSDQEEQQGKDDNEKVGVDEKVGAAGETGEFNEY